MTTEVSRFWDGTTIGDATIAPYDAGTEFSEVMSAVAGGATLPDKGGIFPTPEGELAVSTPATGVVRVQPGQAMVWGAWYRSNVTTDFSIAAPAAAQRIDRIILRKSWSAQTVRMVVVPGIEGGGAPALRQVVGDVWEIPLAQVTVAVNGSLTILDQRKKLGTPDFVETFTDPIVRDTLFFGAKPNLPGDSFIRRLSAGWLGLGSGLLVNATGGETFRNPGTAGAWQNGRVRIREDGWEALDIWGNNAFGTNINLFHTIAGSLWRGVTLSARFLDATPGSQRTSFQIMVSGTGDSAEPATAYWVTPDTHAWYNAGNPILWLSQTNGLYPGAPNLLNLGTPTYRFANIWASWATLYGNLMTPLVTGGDFGNLMLQGGTAASVVVNPPSTFFYPINSTVKSGHPSWPWADIYTNHVSCFGEGVFDGGIRGNGGVFPIGAAANIQLGPSGGIVHPSGNGNIQLGFTNLEWAALFTRWIRSDVANPLEISAPAVVCHAFGAGAPVNLVSDSGQMQFQTGDGFAIMPMRNDTVHMGSSALRWKQGWGVQGWNSSSTKEVKQNWSDLPEGQALAALRLMQFGRFEYKALPSVLENEGEQERLTRWSVGYYVEDTVAATQLVGGEDLFVSRTGRDVEPQRTASVVGAAVQDLDRELHLELAELRARIAELERERAYVNGV